MIENELLHVFLAMFNDGFRPLIHVFAWLKESLVQRSERHDISLVSLSQNITQSLEWLLSYQRNECGVDGIVHHRCL